MDRTCKVLCNKGFVGGFEKPGLMYDQCAHLHWMQRPPEFTNSGKHRHTNYNGWQHTHSTQRYRLVGADGGGV